MNVVADIWGLFRDDIKEKYRKERALRLLETLEDNGIFDPVEDAQELAEAYGTCDNLDAALDEYLDENGEEDDE